MNEESIKQIRKALRAASQHDERAREHRRDAGYLLAELRAQNPQRWHREVGIDARSGELLIEVAIGARLVNG